MLEMLKFLHSLGVVYNGFGILNESAIRIDKKTKKAFLHNFQHSFEFVVGGCDAKAIVSSFAEVKDIPSPFYIFLYLIKNNISVFREIDRQTLSSITDFDFEFELELLVGLSAENVFVELRKKAFSLDVSQLTHIYLNLCNSIKKENRHFEKFVDILKSIVHFGLSADESLERLDHIIE